MVSFDFPRHGEREYIAAIDIAAIIMVRNGARLEFTVTRDIEKTFASLSRVNPRAVLVDAWWVRNRKIALAVAAAIRADVGPWGEAIIQNESQRHGSIAVPHATAMQRMRVAGAQIDAAVRAADASGGLSWFNRAYRLYRQRGGPAMSYQGARARLRRALVRRLVMSGRIELSAGLLPEVFGGAAFVGKSAVVTG